MKINTPGYVSQSGQVTATDGASRETNPLARLLGQLVKAEVLQSTATTNPSSIPSSIPSSNPSPNSNTTPATAPATSGATSDDAAAAPSTSGASTAKGTLPPLSFINTLQIGQSRINITTEQPLAAGSSILLQVLTPTSVQLVDPNTQSAPTTSAPTPAPTDPTTALLNTVLRQALPLQKPVTDVLALLTRLMPLLPQSSASGAPTPPLQSTSADLLALPRPSTELVAQLKPLLTLLLRQPLTPDTVVQPQVLRAAMATTGLFRENNLLSWAEQTLSQGSKASASPMPALPSTGTATIPTATATAPSSLNAAVSPSVSTPAVIDALTQKLSSALTPPAPASGSDSTANMNADNTAAPSQDTDDATLRAQILQAIAARATKGWQPTSTTTASTTTTTTTTNGAAVGVGTAANISATANISASAKFINSISVGASIGEHAASSVAAGISTHTAQGNEAGRTSSLLTSTLTQNPANSSRATTNTSATLVIEDTKTTLERLVVLTAKQLMTRSSEPNNAVTDIGEEQIIALLRNLPLQPHLQTPTHKDAHDDSEWLLQLLRGSFGALKHLQLQQASNLSATPSHSNQSENTTTPLQIELPVYVAQQWHSVNIEIERRGDGQKAANETTRRSWRVTLRFELPDQGIIVAQLNLADNDVTATLWAERQRTCDTLKQQLNDLSQRLKDAGAQVATVDVRHGQPAASKTRVEKRLIDIRT